MGDTLFVSHLTPALLKLTGLAMAAFLLSMAATPIYTYFAYRYRLWKRPRETSVTGERLMVFSKMHE